jgi:hypothetical protein
MTESHAHQGQVKIRIPLIGSARESGFESEPAGPLTAQ